MSNVTSPYVSIIMNCFNGEKFLNEAIDSVYNQSFIDWEIIFFDNASNDNSHEIANSYDDKLRYIRIDQNVCLGKARNLAMKRASGKYIAFLDCDDLYLPFKLEQQVSLMDKNKFVMSYGGAQIIDEYGSLRGNKPAKNFSGSIFKNLLLNYEINMQSVMLLRSYTISENLSFPETFQYGPDYDLFMDIASKQDVGVINDQIVKTRIHSGALTHKKLHCIRDELKSTIDRLVASNPTLAKDYKEEIKLAYGKFEFYQAVYLITSENPLEARKIIKKIINQRWQYLILYILLILNLPKKFILSLLNR
tara:strand:+ start:186 stop:1103 length:918 start_codon:yes stop_codon:yes gene_type:complete